MLRFYKRGKCDWCGKARNCFLTRFGEEENKLMCNSCKIKAEKELYEKYGYSISIDSIEEELLELEVKGEVKSMEAKDISTQFNTTNKPGRVLMEQSDNHLVKLFLVKGKKLWVVEKRMSHTQKTPYDNEWEYENLAPAKRRFNIEKKFSDENRR